MTAGELAVVLARCCAASASRRLIVVLLRVLDTMRSLRAEVVSLRDETGAAAGRAASRRPIDAKADDGRGPRRPRTIRSGARLGRGDQRRRRRQRSRRPRRAAAHRSSRLPPSPPAPRGRCAACGARNGRSRMIKRMTWFVGGAVAGVAGAERRQAQGQAGGARTSPRGTSSTAVNGHESATPSSKVVGRCAPRRPSCARASTDGLTTLADDLDDGDEVLVDGRPVEPGQVIVLKQVRDRRRRVAAVAAA